MNTPARKKRNVAVIGFPVDRSRYPDIHSYWIAQHGILAEYERIAIEADDLDGGLRMLQKGPYVGFNVTRPLKDVIIPHLDGIDRAAQIIGTVNTVVIRDDGTMHGANTDPWGFEQAMTDAFGAQVFTGKKITILGAGHGARSVLYALQNKSAAGITLCCRATDNTHEIINDFTALGLDIRTCDWDDMASAVNGTDILINATPLGVVGGVPLDIDVSGVAAGGIVCDLIYAPVETALLKNAAAAGLKTQSGLYMALHQSRLAFKLWYDILPDIDADMIKMLHS